MEVIAKFELYAAVSFHHLEKLVVGIIALSRARSCWNLRCSRSRVESRIGS